MAIDISDPRELTGANVTGREDEKLGKVDDVYLDNATERPEWAAVKTGLFGTHVSLVPLATAEFRNGTLVVPFSKSEVQNAPHHDPGTELSVDDEKNLFEHYGVSYSGDTATARDGSADAETGGRTQGRHEDTGVAGGQHTDRDRTDAQRTATQGTDAQRTATQGTDAQRTSTQGTDAQRTGREQGSDTRGQVGHDTSGPTTDNAMTRSEEELHVGTEKREAGRARLRKYVVTEHVTQTVPVQHEEVRIEREPITDSNASAAHDGPNISEEEHEVVLHEERPVVDKETVAKERVRLDTETVTEQRQVDEEVRKEQIDTDSGESRTGDRSRTTGESSTGVQHGHDAARDQGDQRR